MKHINFVLEVCVMDRLWCADVKIYKKWKCQISSGSELTAFFNMLPFHYIIFIQDMTETLGWNSRKWKICPSIIFPENIENEETSVVTERENDICKSYCDIKTFTYHDINNMLCLGKTVIGLNPPKCKI